MTSFKLNIFFLCKKNHFLPEKTYFNYARDVTFLFSISDTLFYKGLYFGTAVINFNGKIVWQYCGS